MMALFHEKCGSNVVISADGQLAICLQSACVANERTEVFSAIPIRAGRPFVIQIESREKHHCPVYRIGVTTCNPAVNIEEAWREAWWVGPSSGTKYHQNKVIAAGGRTSRTSREMLPAEPTLRRDGRTPLIPDMMPVEPEKLSIGDLIFVDRGENGDVTVFLNSGTPWGTPTFKTKLDDIQWLWAVVALGKGSSVLVKEAPVPAIKKAKPKLKPKPKRSSSDKQQAERGGYELAQRQQ